MNKVEESRPKPKDNWDKLEVLAKLGAALVIPIITGVATFFITKYQTAPAAIDLAARIYASPQCDENDKETPYCRSKEMDELANYLIKKYVDFELDPGQGRLGPAVYGPMLPGSQQFCNDVCEEDSESSRCKYQCPFWSK